MTNISKELEFFLTLSRAQAVLARRFDGILGSLHGLGLGDFTVLLHLSEAPGGRLRRVDLAERVGLTVSGVTRTLIPLEKIGLVTRQSDARDARVAYAVLTETGRELLTNSLIIAEQISRESVRPDEEKQVETMTEVLLRIAQIKRLIPV